MPIKFSCPHCKCTMTVADALAGKRGKCPKCKGVISVPAPAPVPPPPVLNKPNPAPAPPIPGPTGNGMPAPPAPPPVFNADEEAMRALADEPAEQPKVVAKLEL